MLDAGAVRGEALLLDAGDPQHVASKRHLAGGSDVGSHLHARQHRDQRGEDRDPCGRAILGDRSGGEVDVHVDLREKVVGEPEGRSPRA